MLDEHPSIFFQKIKILTLLYTYTSPHRDTIHTHPIQIPLTAYSATPICDVVFYAESKPPQSFELFYHLFECSVEQLPAALNLISALFSGSCNLCIRGSGEQKTHFRAICPL